MIDKCELFCIKMSKKVIFAFANIVAKKFVHIPWLPFPQQLSELVFRCGRSHWFRSFPQAWLSWIAISLRLTGVFEGRCKLSPEWCPLSDFHETQGWQLTSRHQTWEMYFSPSGCCCLNVWNSNLPDFTHVICLNLENSHGTGEKQLNR